MHFTAVLYRFANFHTSRGAVCKMSNLEVYFRAKQACGGVRKVPAEKIQVLKNSLFQNNEHSDRNVYTLQFFFSFTRSCFQCFHVSTSLLSTYFFFLPFLFSARRGGDRILVICCWLFTRRDIWKLLSERLMLMQCSLVVIILRLKKFMF